MWTGKKTTRAGKRMFWDLATIKALQDSSIIVTDKNGHIMVDQYIWYKESEFNSTQSDFVEPACKKFSKWKNNGKPVTYIRHNNAPENKVFIQIVNESKWKQGETAEYTGKGTHQWNQLAELGSADIADNARAMMVQANLPEEIRYKLWK